MEIFRVPFWKFFFRDGVLTTIFKAFRHTFQEAYGPLDCLHEKIIFDPCNKKLRGMGKFVNARFARFTNSNPKLRRCLSLDWDFSDSFALLTHQKNLAHSFSVFCYRGQN